MFYASNGRRKDALRFRPNDLLQWHAIHDAAAAGYRWYDLAEVEASNDGLASFKAKWARRRGRCSAITFRQSRPVTPSTESPGGPGSDVSPWARGTGFTKRLGNGQAAVGLTQLATLEANLAHRHCIAQRYREMLAPYRFRLPEPLSAASPAYVRYPVWVGDRAAVQRAMGSRAVLGTWFTSVLEEAADPRNCGYLHGTCPRAEDAAQHLVNLPTHARVSMRDAEEIAARVILASR